MKSEESKSDCPAKETLLDFLDGTLEDVKIKDHIEICRQCQSRLDSLSQSDLLQPFRKSKKYHSESSSD